jgi:hypothetical protein
MKKIAFCFLIYDQIIHEELWNLFLKDIDKSKYNIYIHYKTNKPLKYFDEYKIDNCIETSWGNISIIKAQNILLKRGLDDDNTIFCFLSGHCIPLKSFNYIYDNLDDNYSYFNKSPDNECFPRCNSILTILDKKKIKKSNAMYIINKKLANLIIDNEQLIISWFKNIRSADEHCVITLVYYLNLENEIITTPNVSYNGATTFAPWGNQSDYKRYPLSNKINSYTYNSICTEELNILLQSKCLFGRKFNKECKESLNKEEYINFISCVK